ncbi:MAG: hypothetical protein ACD_39C00673G0004, partial [uncultured bacterium]
MGIAEDLSGSINSADIVDPERFHFIVEM